MPEIGLLLNLIQDGTWHSLKELAKHLKFPQQKLEAVSELLAEGRVVEYQQKRSRVKIKNKWVQTPNGTKEEGQNCETTTFGTIVLPPKKAVDVQGIRITNLTERVLEVNVKINGQLEELAVNQID